MQITPRILVNNVLQNVQNQEQQLLKLQNETSTGQVFQYPSDSPSRVTAAMRINAALQQMTPYQESATTAQNWLNQTNGALSDAIQIWDHALSAAVQASNSGQSSQGRTAISNTILEYQKALGQVFNTQYQGTYIFASGYQDQSAPIQPNGSQTATTTPPPSPVGQRVLQIGPNSSVTVNLTGYESQYFGSSTVSTQSIFQKLYNDLGALASAVKQGAQQTSAQINTLNADLGYLTTAQGVTGARLDHIREVLSHLHTLSFDLQKSLTQISGANMAKVTLQLSQEEQAYQATLQSASQVLPLSLLNFIHP